MANWGRTISLIQAELTKQLNNNRQSFVDHLPLEWQATVHEEYFICI
jgi:hypothetical protein